MSTSKTRLLVYGSYGYTGDLVVREAVTRGMSPVLAGRAADKLAAQSAAFAFEARPVELTNAHGLDRALADVAVVLHCAGPFTRTSQAMAEACLRTGTHYLDITGEIAVFEALAARDAEANKARVLLLPGLGFDVVPTDCLAAHLKARLPSAAHLALALDVHGSASRGTTLTALESVGRAGMIRRGGELTPVPLNWKTREFDFGRGMRPATAFPWGDVATAFYSTGIPDIEVYTATPFLRRGLQAARYLGWLTRAPLVRPALERAVRSLPPGASPEKRARGYCLIYGEVSDERGARRAARLRTPDGYTLTAQTAVAAARRVLEGTAAPGFQTPSRAFGADFILQFPGVERRDLD